MTLAKPREHALSKKLRKLSEREDLPTGDAANYRYRAAQLDQTISVLGIWKDPERIIHTNAYRDAKYSYDDYVRRHPGAAV